MSVEVTKKRDEHKAKKTELDTIFKEAKRDDGETEYGRVKCLGKGFEKQPVKVSEKVGELMKELGVLTDDLKKLEAADAAAGVLEDLDGKPVTHITHPSGNGGKERRPVHKSFGDQVIETDIFKKNWSQQGGEKGIIIKLPDISINSIKTLFETGAGWAPESVRMPGFIPIVERPPELLDFIPSVPTGQAAIKYMEETTATNLAATVAEGATFPAATLVLTERTRAVVKIATFIPVTDEQLEDVAGIGAYLDTRLRSFLRQKLDDDLLNGDRTATPEELDGFLNVSGVQTQAKGAYSTPDAVHRALTLVRVTGRAVPGLIVMHPNDWQEIRLTVTGDGVYLWGPPSDAGIPRIWGLPVIQNSAIAEGTALVGDFANYTMLWERRGVTLKISDSHNDYFVNGKQAIRADLRACLTTYRPAALCMITGI